MIKLLGRQTSGNVQKVLFLLEELGIPYTRVDYGRQFGNTQTPEYRALNPNAKVPTLVDGDLVIWESHTILRYLAADTDLGGAGRADKTQVERWMDWLLASLNTPYVAVFKDSKKAPEERAPDFAAQSADMIAQLAILDGQLAGADFVALGRFTLADCALAPVVARCLDFPVERPAFPNVERWRAAMAERPAFQVAVGSRPSTIAQAA
ncbi:glutathione S-transferase family protein [Azospirillum sp. ST 5-10]|uniref:glutathione S-transferase family protein n=1 Tax=unclassified Azospirillum TaxID=2630922 RepID=UPI003F4A705C